MIYEKLIVYFGVAAKSTRIDKPCAATQHQGGYSWQRDDNTETILHSTKVATADHVMTILKPSYTVSGNPRRGDEELIMVQLTTFLQDA